MEPVNTYLRGSRLRGGGLGDSGLGCSGGLCRGLFLCELYWTRSAYEKSVLMTRHAINLVNQIEVTMRRAKHHKSKSTNLR